MEIKEYQINFNHIEGNNNVLAGHIEQTDNSRFRSRTKPGIHKL